MDAHARSVKTECFVTGLHISGNLNVQGSGAGLTGLRIKWNEFLYNFGEMKRAKTIGLPVVAMATKNKQCTSFQKRFFLSGA